jgi:molybdopterin adenylyltransferase
MENVKIHIRSVNISEKKGTIKKPVDSIELFEEGVKRDAHSGKWNRMVSLLGKESVERFSKEAGRNIAYGEFAENITTEGMELFKTHPLDRLINDDVVLEVTQIGKKCHGSNCQIYREVGNCVMPKEGIFARVIKKGELKAKNTLLFEPKVFKVGIITLSNRAAAGMYKDGSGPAIENLIKDYFLGIQRQAAYKMILIPDSKELLKENIHNFIEDKYDIIFTTGGTGIGSKDITPDVVSPLLDKEIPGIMDLIRLKYGKIHPSALISRSIAGVINKTLVYCLPGSPRAVKEYVEEIQKTLLHSIYMLHELDLHA